jgi:hypothetical protein
MVRYRRNFVAGGTFFFTVTLADRASRALIDHIEALRRAVKQMHAAHPFAIDAVVILPDHFLLSPAASVGWEGVPDLRDSAQCARSLQSGLRLAQLHRTVVSAHSAIIMRFAAISILGSWPKRNVITPDMSRQAARATIPRFAAPVASLIQPMA